MVEVVWKGVVGGLATALIVLLSRRGNVLPGILQLFPTFAVIALAVIGARGNTSGFREACMAGAKTIPAYLVFLGVCYGAIGSLDYRLAIALGLVAWLAAVLLVLFVLFVTRARKRRPEGRLEDGAGWPARRETRPARQAIRGRGSGNPARQLALRRCAGLLGRQLAALEHHQHRNRLDTELGRDLRILVDIDLGDLDLAGHLRRDLIESRGDHAARTAPFGPEIDDHRLRRIENVGFERSVRDLDRIGTHLESPKARAARLPPQSSWDKAMNEALPRQGESGLSRKSA
jgi:uncharacterized membrane protein (GlpM family)